MDNEKDLELGNYQIMEGDPIKTPSPAKTAEEILAKYGIEKGEKLQDKIDYKLLIAAMQEYAQQSGGYSREDIKNGLITSWDACEQYINVLMSQHKTKFVNKDTFIENYLSSLTTKQ